MNSGNKLVLAAAIALSFSTGLLQPAHAAAGTDIQPEVAANVWEDDNAEYASVSLNGKDLLTYKATSDNHVAEQKAEDLADRLKDLLQDNKFDPSKLTPAKEGELAAIKVDGATVLKFDVSQTVEGNKSSGSPAIEQSLKMINAIRTSMGVAVLPASILKMPDRVNPPDRANPVLHTAKAIGNLFSGHASWYGGKFHGRKTSDGSRFNQDGFTAAHRSLPFGTRLLVMNRKTGDSCVVQVNDRGPFVGDRVIDLSRGAAKKINMLGSGVALVDCLVLGAND